MTCSDASDARDWTTGVVQNCNHSQWLFVVILTGRRHFFFHFLFNVSALVLYLIRYDYTNAIHYNIPGRIYIFIKRANRDLDNLYA